MRSFTFRGARVRVTGHKLIVAQDLTRLLFGRQNLDLLGGLPVGTVVMSRDGAVHLMNSARYPHAVEFLIELDKMLEPDPRTPIQIQLPDLRSRIQSANTIEDLRSVLLELYLEIQGP